MGKKIHNKYNQPSRSNVNFVQGNDDSRNLNLNLTGSGTGVGGGSLSNLKQTNLGIQSPISASNGV